MPTGGGEVSDPDRLPTLKQTAYTHAHNGSTKRTRWIYKRNMKLGGTQREDRGVIRHKHEILNKMFKETFTPAKML